MTDRADDYAKPPRKLPPTTLTWRLRGAGMESFGRDGAPEEVTLPQPGPHEVLVRVDALGLCFSDVKLIGLGDKHARVYGRDLAADPVVPGHEVSLTIAAVGSELRDRFRVGDRYIVQADAIFHGEARAYGYALPGGMTQYGLIGERILDGDEGCYLIPLHSNIGYAETALTEPWACVEASYRIEPRRGLKPGGVALFLGLPDGRFDEYILSAGMDSGGAPAKVVAAGVGGKFGKWLRSRADELGIAIVEVAAADKASLATLRDENAPAGFDDTVVLGSSDADLIEAAAAHLAHGGVMNIMAAASMSRRVSIDVGGVHYEGHDYVGDPGADIAASYGGRDSQPRGGPAWFIGGAGPIGQMHVQRAIEQVNGPRVIVVTDVDDARLAALNAKVAELASRYGKPLTLINPSKLPSGAVDARLRQVAPDGFSDIVLLAPVPELIEQAAPHLAYAGALNIFAGLARGTMARLDLSLFYLRKARIFGSSGSSIADLEYTLRATEAGKLKTNSSVAAIGDMRALAKGIEAVRTGRFAGKVVIFPHVENVPLTSMSQLHERLPQVYAKLGPGETWTREAERELLRSRLPRDRDGGDR
jgi:threonine dehydrogenase-like Zn-dependent dehydrogenase